MKDHTPSMKLIVHLEQAAEVIKDEFWEGHMWGNSIAFALYSRLQEDIALFTKMRGDK